MTQGILTHWPDALHPDPSRTVMRPFIPSDPTGYENPDRSRAGRIADRVLALSDAELDQEIERILVPLMKRHRGVEASLIRRFRDVRESLGLVATSNERAVLVGVYLTQEYTFEAAALFNPSVVAAPLQIGVPAGALKIILSLRAIGEGHVSSITFRTGTWSPGEAVRIDPVSPYSVPPRIEGPPEGDGNGAIELVCNDSQDVSETVVFPSADRHRAGIEDARFVRFAEDDGETSYYATYTAFDGRNIQSELLVANDLKSFTMRPMTGRASRNKGMALFPRRVGGRYAMIGRQDNESIWFLQSDDLFDWEGGERIVSPRYPWEFVQMGNCGSPIELEEGWLLLTHGVGAGRNYCVGACLLDKEDPSKVLARTPKPLIEPSPEDRGGYVPNVVYSCGGLVHGRMLLLPYAVADSFTRFATGSVDDVLGAMT